MKLTTFERNLIKKIEQNLPGAAPGVLVQVHQAGRKVCDIAVGETYVYYDLASLTKVIFCVQALIKAFQDGKWNLKTRVQEALPWFPHADVLVIDLLTHSSGLPWWYSFYQNIGLEDTVEEKWNTLARIIRELPRESKEESVYSDVGFLTLAFVLESLYEAPLMHIWSQIKEIFYPRLSLDFHENNTPIHPVRFYAPTEKCPWRRRVLQGEVHDENTWALGGVSSHAGLFGSIDDVGWFSLFVRGQLLGISKTVIKQKTAQLFATRARPIGKGDWALGYMMPTPGHSSSGDYFSPYSIGHTGFTGTSVWYDPAQDLSIVILSNRLAFGRQVQDFKLLRPKIHNWIVEGLRRA